MVPTRAGSPSLASTAPLARRASSVDACARRLRDAIVGGELAPGSFLPPERALAAQLGINRTTLRAAIHRLAESGLLEAQQGRGTRVLDFRAHASVELAAVTDGEALEGASLDLPSLAQDLLAVRRALARVVLEALVERPAAAEAVENVTAAIDTLDHLAHEQAPLDRVADADLAVLAAIVDATGRPGLRLCMNPVARTLRALPRLAAAIHVAPAESVAAFRAVAGFLARPRAADVEILLGALAARDEATLARLRAPAPPRRPRTEEP